MFFSRRLKPVVDPRPVAELSLHARSAAPLNDIALTERHSAASGHVPPICFTVSYHLVEYLSIVGDFIPIAMREAGKGVERLGSGTRLALALITGPIFLYKKLRVGTCRFLIDSQGLTRLSRNSKIVLPWHEVHSVHALGQGYLVRKRSGAMPLPYRCFSAEERARFERWAVNAIERPIRQATGR